MWHAVAIAMPEIMPLIGKSPHVGPYQEAWPAHQDSESDRHRLNDRLVTMDTKTDPSAIAKMS